MDVQIKSGLGGAGNTVNPRPNHCEGVAMDSLSRPRQHAPEQHWVRPDDPAYQIGHRSRGDILADLAQRQLPNLDLSWLSTPPEKIYEGPIPRPLVATLEDIAPGCYDVRYLYVFMGPRGLIYVGQTWSPAARFVSHRKRNRFWCQAPWVSIFRHQFAGVRENVDREIIELEREAISSLVPIYNVDRSLAEVDAGAPWAPELQDANIQASNRARELISRGA